MGSPVSVVVELYLFGHATLTTLSPLYTRTKVVMGDTTVQTNQRAAFRSRGTNGPISVQQEVM